MVPEEHGRAAAAWVHSSPPPPPLPPAPPACRRSASRLLLAQRRALPLPLAALAFLAVDLLFCRGPLRGPLLRLFSQSGQSKDGQRRFLSQVGAYYVRTGMAASPAGSLRPTTCGIVELDTHAPASPQQQLPGWPALPQPGRHPAAKPCCSCKLLCPSMPPSPPCPVPPNQPNPQLAAKVIGILFLSAVMPLVRPPPASLGQLAGRHMPG